MREHVSTVTRSHVFAILVLALLAAALTGCGVGKATNEEKINKTASTYLRALADGDTAEACAQLTRRAKGERCESAMKERLSGLDADVLKNAADGSIDVEIDGDSATPRGAYPFKTFFGRASRSSSGLAPSYARRAVAECFSRSRSRRAVVRVATTACPRVVAASPSPR
jgi:hypothetical protein